MRNFACGSDRLRERLAGLVWRLIEDGPAPGAWNMAVDEALLEAARRNEAPPTLRFYSWRRPTLSLGRHQDPRESIDHAYRSRRGIDLVRRPTGGRAVLHDQEVTYSIVLPAALGRGAGVREVYGVLSGALFSGLTEILGVFRCSGVQVFRPARSKAGPSLSAPEHPNTRSPEHLSMASCFATAAGGDGLTEAGKLVGSAQARRGGAVLQHGSVLLAVRHEDWKGLFGSAGIEVAVADLVSPPPGEETVRVALRHGLVRALGATLVPGIVSLTERSGAERLVAERHGVGCLD